MKVLIIGGGGREHALAWKAAQSPNVKKVFVAPGNAGTALEKKIKNVAIDAGNITALLEFAQKENIDLTIVGPEVPLALGIVDLFNQHNLHIFGATQKAAQLESSKAFAKDFLARHNIPTAEYKTFTDAVAAIDYVKQKQIPIVIKADGLAAGKGVIIAQTLSEAENAITDMLSGNTFGEAGSRVVVEEFLSGEEASFIVMADGVNVLPLATSQDHKARDDGDLGPNTGGMGAYSPAPVVTPDIHARILAEVIYPTIEGMAKEGIPYSGFLYAGIMITKDGTPKVLEFNCRMGDPETQPIMLRLKSDLVELCQAAVDQHLDKIEAHWDSRAAVGVVLAAGGYPDQYPKGEVIQGLSSTQLDDCKIFHAGTRLEGTHIVTNGGRVLCVTALGQTVTLAQQRAYTLVGTLSWEHMHYRTDIGYRAIKREQH
jgi:phosphoribosylamine---glycine ligase